MQDGLLSGNRVRERGSVRVLSTDRERHSEDIGFRQRKSERSATAAAAAQSLSPRVTPSQLRGRRRLHCPSLPPTMAALAPCSCLCSFQSVKPEAAFVHGCRTLSLSLTQAQRLCTLSPVAVSLSVCTEPIGRRDFAWPFSPANVAAPRALTWIGVRERG